jgi:hypothetical protein
MTHPGRKAAAPLVALALLAALWWPTLRWPLGRDQGVYAAVADVINDGGLLYRDALDLKPPVIYHLYALALRFSHSEQAIRVMDLLMIGAGMTFILLLFPARRRWALAPLLALTTGTALFFLAGYWNAALPDSYTAIPIAAGLWVRQTRWGRVRVVSADAVMGLLTGVAFWLKYTAGIYLLLFAFLAYLDWRKGGGARPSSLFLRWGAMALGFVALAAAVVLHFALRGGLRDLWEVGFVYPLHYAGYQPRLAGDLWIGGINLSQGLRGFRIFCAWFPPLVLLPLALLAVCALRRRLPHRELWLATALALLSVVIQGKFYMNHFGAALLWLAALSALAIEASARLLRARLRWRRDRWTAVTALALGVPVVAVLVLGSSVFPQRWATLRAWMRIDPADPATVRSYQDHFGAYGQGDFSYRADVEVADYLRATTAPQDKVFIWGFEPLVLFLANRRSPTRFLDNAPLVAPPGRFRWREEALEALRRDPPACVLILRDDDQWYLHGVHGDSRETLAATNPDLAKWISRNYSLGRQIEHFAVLRRVPVESPAP